MRLGTFGATLVAALMVLVGQARADLIAVSSTGNVTASTLFSSTYIYFSNLGGGAYGAGVSLGVSGSAAGTFTLTYDNAVDCCGGGPVAHNRYIFELTNNTAGTLAGVTLSIQDPNSPAVFFPSAVPGPAVDLNPVSPPPPTTVVFAGNFSIFQSPVTPTLFDWMFTTPLAPGGVAALYLPILVSAGPDIGSPLTITLGPIAPSEMPEPSSVAILSLGLVALGVARRRARALPVAR